jgi:electron transport complex protein RnfE
MDAVSMGIGFTTVLVLLGAIREFIGFGTLLAGAEQLFGDKAAHWQLQVGEGEHGVLLAILPPGAFFGLALLVALKNWIDQHRLDTQLSAKNLEINKSLLHATRE